METVVKWDGNARYVAESGSGHTVLMDGPPDHGGENLGPRPMEMLLMGIGGCSNFDVMMILKKRRQDVEDCVVYIQAERAEKVPAVFTKIHLRFVVTGRNIKESAVDKAVTMSAEKYCSASIMMQNAGVDVTHSYEVVQLDS